MSDLDAPKTSDLLLKEYETLRGEQIQLTATIQSKYQEVNVLETQMHELSERVTTARKALLGRVDDSLKETV